MPLSKCLNCILLRKLYVFNLTFFCLINLTSSGIMIYEEDNNQVEQFSDKELPFSKYIGEDGIEGAIVHANPPNACTKILGPPSVNITMNWFVLIAGNFCDYDTKVMNSELAGYDVAVIYSNRGRDDVSTGHHVPTVNISAVTIRTRSGKIIKDNYLYTVDKRYRVYIYPNNAIRIMTFLLLFAVIAGIFVIIMFSFTVIRFIQQVQYERNNRLCKEHLKRLQTSKFNKGDPYETCAICLEDFKSRERLRILPCFHGYHAKCIDPWLTKNRRVCPVCKKKVILTSELSEHETESSEERGESTPLLSSTEGMPIPNYSAGASSSILISDNNAAVQSSDDKEQSNNLSTKNDTPVVLPIVSDVANKGVLSTTVNENEKITITPANGNN